MVPARAGEAAVRQLPRSARAGRRVLYLDLDAHHVSRAGQEIQLTPTEFRLLRCFVENAGRVLSPSFILEDVWGAEYADEIGYIRRYVWYLRQKIEPDPADPSFILTEREFGYRFRKA